MCSYVHTSVPTYTYVHTRGPREYNAQQVEKIRRIVEELGNEVATPDEAREILALKGGDRVKF